MLDKTDEQVEYLAMMESVVGVPTPLLCIYVCMLYGHHLWQVIHDTGAILANVIALMGNGISQATVKVVQSYITQEWQEWQ